MALIFLNGRPVDGSGRVSERDVEQILALACSFM